MTAPSQTPEAAGLEAKGVVWHNLHGQECIGWILPREYFRKEPEAPKHLVTAASAQAAIDAEKARADRLAKALEDIENVADSFCDDSADLLAGQIRIRARAALQQETQP